MSEDHIHGALRKYTPPLSDENEGFVAGWHTLHEEGGKTEYLVMISGNTFAWTKDIAEARISQNLFFPNVEGIDYLDGEQLYLNLDLLCGSYRDHCI